MEAVRIPAGELTEPTADIYVGRPGLPPLKEIYRPAYYRIRLQDDGLEYDVQGKSIRKITYYEDLLLAESKRLIAAGKFDEAFDYLVALLQLAPQWPGLLAARIDYYREESTRFAVTGNWESAFWSLVEENRLRAEFAALSEDARGPESFGAGTFHERFESVGRRWIERLVADRRYDETRRAIARIESVEPASESARRGRQTLDDLTEQLLASARNKQSAGDFRGALVDLDYAITVQPDSPCKPVPRRNRSTPSTQCVARRRRSPPSFRGRLPIGIELTNVLPSYSMFPSCGSKAWRMKGPSKARSLTSLEKLNINKQAVVRLKSGLVGLEIINR
ncbi:MAG: hypothetical protein U1D30_25475 [Planctomycetota bacterium]